ncbi:hypothetical protein GOM49_01335 [Clostridium bovifaecis]|uniref:MurNAc-LAA domain-containing protein n=1 Tax=Clostridium bovifaecis TaxID=2184719 RepID=A0A6I6F8A6_9CLOT|nr:hypothetical protein GOM49_01335 [Clostridium bovifaecis]
MSWIKRFVMFSVAALFIVIGLSPKVLAVTYKDIGQKLGQETNKVWNIKFNNEVDPSSINTTNIVVLDDKNVEVKIKVECKDSKTVSVSPIYSYQPGKTYTLIVKEGVKSKLGGKINLPTRMVFTTKALEGRVVALDAGRAGNDIGYEVGPTGVKGKDINLYVALRAGEILKANGVQVIYTRTTDNVSWSPEESIAARSKIVNDAKANVLVSIHCNSASTTATGSETYYLQGNDNSKNLASYVQEELYNRTKLPNRGIKESTLKTLSGVSATGVYVDLGFITNPTEEKILNSEVFKNNSAEAIASAVLKYLNIKEQAYIKSIPDKTVLLYKNEKYTLPTTVDALMSDNITSKVAVNWDKSYVDTSTEGTYYYKGTVTGYSGAASLKVVVSSQTEPGTSTDTIKSINNITVNLTEGDTYSLPTKVDAINTLGAKVQVNVIWDKSSVDTSKVGTVTLVGRVENYSNPVVLTIVISPKPTIKYKVALDAGHGGTDPGAIGPNGIKEKDITLAVTLKLGAILEKQGIEVVYTRTNDTAAWLNSSETRLKTRVDIANNANVDYFVSIHANSVDGSPTTSGIETYYYRETTSGIPLATNIQSELISKLGAKDRGIKSSGLYVVKYTNAPAVLVELEFISNPQKEAMLNDPVYQQKYAEAIASGIIKTIGK